MSLPARLGRPMLASMFVMGGVDQLFNTKGKVSVAEGFADEFDDTLEQSPLPTDPDQLVKINGVVQVVGGALLATNKLPRLASLALAGSLVPTTYAAHRFWEEDDPDARQQQQVQFFKNVAMLGGLLVSAGDTGGRPSASWRARRALKRSSGPDLSQAKDTAGDLASSTGDALSTAGSHLGDAAGGAGTRLAAAASTAGDRLRDTAETVAETAPDKAAELRDTLRRTAEVVVPAVAAFASQASNKTSEAASRAAETARKLNEEIDLRETASVAADRAQKAAESVRARRTPELNMTTEAHPNDPTYAGGASTLDELLAELSADGYDADLRLDGTMVRCPSCEETYGPEAAKDVVVRRMEGASDPADSDIVVGLRCPQCDTAGTMTLDYGARASADEADFLRALPNDPNR